MITNNASGATAASSMTGRQKYPPLESARTGAYSRESLRRLSKYEVVKIYRSIFKDSPHCHSDEPQLWESIYDAILTGIPQKIDPTWD